jgi:hypothetical protein
MSPGFIAVLMLALLDDHSWRRFLWVALLLVCYLLSAYNEGKAFSRLVQRLKPGPKQPTLPGIKA